MGARGELVEPRALVLPPSLKLRRTAVARSAEAGRQTQDERFLDWEKIVKAPVAQRMPSADSGAGDAARVQAGSRRSHSSKQSRLQSWWPRFRFCDRWSATRRSTKGAAS